MEAPGSQGGELLRFVIITGTTTGVGKTVVTAAIARLALDAALRVCVVKPVQTGVVTSDHDRVGQRITAGRADQGDPPDIYVIERLSGCRDVHQLVTLADPLAPDTAARLRGLTIPSVEFLSEQVASLATATAPATATATATSTGYDVVLVEGSGGVAVRLDTAGGTLIDLAGYLTAEGHRIDFVVVTGLALGTLNFTELTVQALTTAGHAVAGLVLGDVPACLGLAEQCNLEDLPRVTGVPVLGALPHGVGGWEPARFQAACRTWFTVDPLQLPQL